jgi:hypothetical protein
MNEGISLNTWQYKLQYRVSCLDYNIHELKRLFIWWWNAHKYHEYVYVQNDGGWKQFECTKCGDKKYSRGWRIREFDMCLK